jgi:hypothetical protein
MSHMAYEVTTRTVGCMNHYLCNIIVSEQNEHFRVMSAKRIGDVRVVKVNVWVTLCCFLDLY